ncbi:MAG TPA: poly-beta-hydroxybutyrate-responsive repressor [Bacillales bacterium]|nr:poly-beta-hydroxybutyrate-responsive repressor [Bacillales bacterium]
MAENSNQKSNMEKGIGGSPKNLMVPFLLLSLRGGFGLHGYKLIQQLTQLGFSSIDQGNVYRLLRQLEKDNLVKSEWDTTSSGPAKRIYSITDVGHEYLDLWAESLGQYQTMLDHFFTMYSNMFMPLVPKDKKEDLDEK